MAEDAHEALPTVDVHEAMAFVADGGLLVDVREQDEWDAGHADPAQFLPLSALQERTGELPADTRFMVICHSGMRSQRATAFLRGAGFDAVNVAGGTAAWIAAGGPLSANTAGA